MMYPDTGRYFYENGKRYEIGKWVIGVTSKSEIGNIQGRIGKIHSLRFGVNEFGIRYLLIECEFITNVNRSHHTDIKTCDSNEVVPIDWSEELEQHFNDYFKKS